MIPIEFDGFNATFAEDQPEYLPLPCFKNAKGEIIICWRLSFKERLKALLFGKVWQEVLTFNKPLQPIKLSLSKPWEEL